MVAMRVMQVAVHQVVHMIAVRHRFMAAIGPVHVIRVMARAAVLGRALRGVFGIHFQAMLVHMAVMHVMQMAIVQIVGVAVVLDGGVAAGRAVLMGVFAGVLRAVSHCASLF